MIKIEYNNNSISINDINTYLKMENYYDNSISINDINTYLKIQSNYDDIDYIYQTYDQFHPEYKRIIELFNFGLGM